MTSLVIGDRNLTGKLESWQYSNVDPGGFEAATITLSGKVPGIYPGQPVTIYEGLAVAWMGRVNEPAPLTDGQRSLTQVVALGAGAPLKDDPYREVYVDRDLTRWSSPALAQQLAIASGGDFLQDSGQVAADAAGDPALVLSFTTLPEKAMGQAWYDAQGIALASLYYDLTALADSDTPFSSAWQTSARLHTDDSSTAGATDTSGDLDDSAAGYVIATDDDRLYASVLMYWPSGSGAVDTGTWKSYWRKLAVYGRHGLVGRGADPVGLYPTDVALDALGRSTLKVGSVIVAEDAGGYIAPHVVYFDPATPETVIGDMVRLLGWHWGVWEPMGLGDTLPSFWLVPPPTDATVWIHSSDGDLDPPKVRLDTLYDACEVTFTDAAGKPGRVTVTLANPLLDQAGVGTRTLQLTMGTSTAARATDYATAALGLTQTAQRGGGSVTLRDTVGVAGGGHKPATLLRSGRDRLRIVDLPDSGPVTSLGDRRYDTFRVARVETTGQRGQATETRVEFDGGADLLEVLNARLAAAAPAVGA